MWETINRFVTIQSKWVTILGENVLDSEDNQLEYWRVEKDDSVIIFPLHKKTYTSTPVLQAWNTCHDFRFSRRTKSEGG